MPDTAWLQVVGYASAGLVGYVGGYLTLRRTIDRLEKGQDEMRKALRSLETNAALTVTKDDLANALAPVNKQMGALTAAVAKTATKDDLAQLATSTKDDLAQLATSAKDDLARLATREDLKDLGLRLDRAIEATKDDLVHHATREDLKDVNSRLNEVSSKLDEVRDERRHLATKEDLRDVSLRLDRAIEKSAGSQTEVVWQRITVQLNSLIAPLIEQAGPKQSSAGSSE